jgi:hypothetical protein
MGELTLKNIDRPIRAFRVEWDEVDWQQASSDRRRGSPARPTATSLQNPLRRTIPAAPATICAAARSPFRRPAGAEADARRKSRTQMPRSDTMMVSPPSAPWAMRASRSAGAVEETLTALEGAARDGGNLMPYILAAASAYATVGEISDRLRAVFGEYHEG